MLAEILSSLLGLISAVLDIYVYLLIAAVIISWVNADPYNQIVRFIRSVTEPVLTPARRMLWSLTRSLQIDLSPMLVMFAIVVVQIVIRRLRAALYTGF